MGGVELPRVLAENIGACLLDVSTIVMILLTSKKMSYFAVNKRKEAESDEENVPLRSGNARGL